MNRRLRRERRNRRTAGLDSSDSAVDMERIGLTGLWVNGESL